MKQMPTLGAPPKKSPLGAGVAAAAVIGIGAGGVFFFTRGAPPAAPVTAAAEVPTAAALAAPPPTPGLPPPSVAIGGSGLAAPSAPPNGALAPVETIKTAGLARASVTLEGPLETALVQAVGREVGPALAQVVTRALVWWVVVPSELRRGDKLDLVFQERTGEEPVVHAVRYTSAKLGKTVSAFRFKSSQDSFARFYSPAGEELELRLEPPPIDDYEQVTSLMRDGRRHKGVDFKAPVGTPVRATFNGTVTRKNWNFRSNGNTVELTEAGGRRKALYLHLSELPKTIRVGQQISRGEVIAQSGNSGRSFAPHLHYQLMSSSDRVLDPFAEHRTGRKSLGSGDHGSFEAEVRRLESFFQPAVAGN